MATDVAMAADFYATRQGTVTARLVRERLAVLWPDLAGQTLLGIGYPAPFLRLWRDRATRCIALTPAQAGAARWPAGLANLSCTAEEDALPFPDLSFDRILVVHGLEGAENARRMLRELWRVLKDDGRLLMVVPNRRSPWAYVEATPFGQGQPYSPRQLGVLLAASLFRIERRDTALYLPPLKLRLLLRSAALWERTGRRLAPQFAGVTISEAVKDCFAALPAKPVFSRRLVLSETI
ncbi:MAG: class I SAM-dependent methyltransferase [Acetobacteraceae bacterium]